MENTTDTMNDPLTKLPRVEGTPTVPGMYLCVRPHKSWPEMAVLEKNEFTPGVVSFRMFSAVDWVYPSDKIPTTFIFYGPIELV